METMIAILRPLSVTIDEKLGRCARCMRWSAGLTAASLLLLALAIAGGAAAEVLIAAGVPFAAFTALSLAHAVAYVVRPAPAAGCSSCAAKTKARARDARIRRVSLCLRRPWSCLRRRTTAPSRTTGKCGSCRKPRSVEEAAEMADQLPPADEGLRAVVEASREFQSLRARLAADEPADSWRVDDRNHFVYDLKPETDGAGATALFAARWDDDTPSTAVVVIPDPNGGEPRIVHLRT